MMNAQVDGSNAASMKTRRDRYADGKALRAACAREEHSAFVRTPRDPLAILADQDKNRIPQLLPVRYQRMAHSAFEFFRGADAIMSHDLAHAPMSGARVQGAGDSHILNFGAATVSNGATLFDINDFDETLGNVDFTLDVKRLAASVAVAMQDRGATARAARAAAQSCARAYRRHVRMLAKLSPIAIWQSRVDVAEEIKRLDDKKLQTRLTALLQAARKGEDGDANFPHLVKTQDGKPQIQDKPPLIFHFSNSNLSFDSSLFFQNYRASLAPERAILLDRYGLRDEAFKVVGVGSVGTFCVIGLYMTGDDEPLFLQVKEAQKSVLEKISPASAWDGSQGRRVVQGQRILQAESDVFLGWFEDEKSGRHFYVRQLKNRRLGSLGEILEESALVSYSLLCARTLARAHARAGDSAVLAGYMGRGEAFDAAIAAFALSYAEQNAEDYAKLLAASKTADPGQPS